jgi:hypothetical protein
MKLVVVDSSGVTQTILVAGQEAVVNQSGSITATGTSQLLVAANANRSGFLMQNLGTSVMYVNDLGGAATATGDSFQVAPGAFFPPPGYAVTTNALNVLGTIGDKYVAREW